MSKKSSDFIQILEASYKRSIYFVSIGNPEYAYRFRDCNRAWLFSPDTLRSKKDFDYLKIILDEGHTVLFDSGVFVLASSFARKMDYSYERVLKLEPSRIPNYDRFNDIYLSVIEQYGSRLWGYVEMDFGGETRKTQSRTSAEANGYNPIPVYHPLIDSAEYLETLLSSYQRICWGGLARAGSSEHIRLMAMAWDVHRRYPNCWFHFLGVGPRWTLYAYPVNSYDSTSWRMVTNWGGDFVDYVMGKTFKGFSRDFSYELGSDPNGITGSMKVKKMALISANCSHIGYVDHLVEMENHNVEIY